MNRKIKLGIGIFFLIVGCCVFMIPIGVQLYNKAQQQQMLETLKKEIQKNTLKNDSDINDSDINDSDINDSDINDSDINDSDNKDLENISKESYTEDAGTLEKEFIDLELDEEEAIEDSQTSEFLKYQKVIGLIEIVKLNIVFPIVEGTNRDNIRAAIGHMSNTRTLGEKGNCVLAGHRGGVYGEFFKNIHKLERGDEIKVMDASGTEFIYIVLEQFLVEPTDYTVCDDIGEETSLTLLSCEDNATKRRIVRCMKE